MKIMIVSKCTDFARQVMEKLDSEGHNVVSILYSADEIRFKRRFHVYNYSHSRSQCELIIRTHSPDFIMFLASVHLSDGDCDLSAEMPLFRDVLNCASGQRIILQSDCHIFGLTEDFNYSDKHQLIRTSVETQTLLNEVLFKSLCSQKNLSLTILRTGIIYGTEISDGRIRRMLMGERDALYVKSSPDDFWNLLYITDALEAINRCIKNDIAGVYNVCGLRWIKLRELSKIVSQNDIFIQFDENPAEPRIVPKPAVNSGAYVESTGCYKKFKDATDWLPLVDIQEGLSHEAVGHKEQSKRAPFKIKKLFMQIVPSLSVIFGFALTLLIQNFLKNDAALRIFDLRLIFIIVIASRCGTTYGLLAAILSSISYYFDNYHYSTLLTEIIYDSNRWLPFIIFILLGTSFGYWKKLQQGEKTDLTTEVGSLKKKYSDLENIYTDTLIAKNAMQEQIFNVEDSFGSVFNMVEKLDSVESRHVIRSAVAVLEQALHINKVAIYYISGGNADYARLMTCSKELADIKPSIRLTDFPELRLALSEGKFYLDNKLSSDISCAYPIMKHGVPVYIVALCGYSLQQFTLAFQNRFTVICSLIKNSLLRAMQYEEAVWDKHHFEGTIVLRPEHFVSGINAFIKDTSLNKGNCRLLKVQGQSDIYQLSGKIEKILRKYDFVGLDHRGGLHIAFLNTAAQKDDSISSRFAGEGIYLQPVKIEEVLKLESK